MPSWFRRKSLKSQADSRINHQVLKILARVARARKEGVYAEMLIRGFDELSQVEEFAHLTSDLLWHTLWQLTRLGAVRMDMEELDILGQVWIEFELETMDKLLRESRPKKEKSASRIVLESLDRQCSRLQDIAREHAAGIKSEQVIFAGPDCLRDR